MTLRVPLAGRWGSGGSGGGGGGGGGGDDMSGSATRGVDGELALHIDVWDDDGGEV